MADFKIYIFTKKIAINNTSWKSIELNNSMIHGISTVLKIHLVCNMYDIFR